MSVASLSLARLPRAPAHAAGASRAIARVLAASARSASATVPGLGALTIAGPRVVFPDGATPGERLALDGAAGRAQLRIDPALALVLVERILGVGPTVALRPLGRAERGVLAAACAAALDALDAPADLRVSLDEGEGPGDGDLVGVAVEVVGPGLRGVVQVEAPAAWWAACRHPLRAHAPLDFVLTVAVARTTLAAAEVAGLGPGDAVVFERGPLAATAVWTGEVTLGPLAAPAEIRPDGTVALAGALTHRRQESHMADTNDTVPLPSLGDLPVEIVAEVGRVTARLDEVAGLAPGSVLPLGPLRPDTVSLRAGGKLLARGELVEVDGALGVRVTEVIGAR